MSRKDGQKILIISGIFFSILLFSLLTVFAQVRELGLFYIEEGDQVARHVRVLQGRAGDPWQYRVLSEYLVEAALQIIQNLRIPRPVAAAFIGFRILQNIVIFSIAAIYYRKLGLNIYTMLIGLSLLSWAMTHSLYDSDL
jgi:hypothetical protein